MRAQKPVWDVLCKYYFRLETSGWERLPEQTSLLIGNHSGGSLTMDAWTFVSTGGGDSAPSACFMRPLTMS